MRLLLRALALVAAWLVVAVPTALLAFTHGSAESTVPLSRENTSVSCMTPRLALSPATSWATGTFSSSCFWIAAWMVRAKRSVPPPAPEVTTNSTGRFGSQAARAGRGAVAAKEAAPSEKASVSVGRTRILVSSG